MKEEFTINRKYDGRHKVSDRMLNNLKTTAYMQDNFGMDKYKKPLFSGMPYNWLAMAKEELVDMAKYLECEEVRKETVTQMLIDALALQNWELVHSALSQLMMKGTGKKTTE